LYIGRLDFRDQRVVECGASGLLGRALRGRGKESPEGRLV
jgi:hypothetical protein